MKTKTKSLAETIADCKFDWTNSDIEKRFTLGEPRSADYKIFHFDRDISSEDAVKEIEKEGYSPSTLSELLAYAQNGWNDKDWVVALGSVARVHGHRNVPCLVRGERDRILNLHWWVGGWGGRCRFLAVRNSLLTIGAKPFALGNSDALTLISEIEERIERLKEIV